jgi:hypothetical protein
MVLSGDVASDCNLTSFRNARFFDFFNEIAPQQSFEITPLNGNVGAKPPFKDDGDLVRLGYEIWKIVFIQRSSGEILMFRPGRRVFNSPTL